MLKSRTYTEQVLRWKLIPPCAALFFDTARGSESRETRMPQGLPARPARAEFLRTLLNALIPGESRCGRGQATERRFSRFVALPFRRYRWLHQ
jgi:hypothetical protein